MKAKFLVTILACFLASTFAHAQESSRGPDHGGLGDYPVPQVQGGAPEFEYCVLFTKRIWRFGNMISEKNLSFEQAKKYANNELGENAAREEIAELEAFEKNQITSPQALAAERFYRCAQKLKLAPTPENKIKAEKCFDSLHLLEYVARQRNLGASKERVREFLQKRLSSMPADFLNQTLELAYSGKSVRDGSTLIEDAFTTCFARSNEAAPSTP